jgi:hypothetical protein
LTAMRRLAERHSITHLGMPDFRYIGGQDPQAKT